MTAEPADQLSTALEATQRVLAHVHDDQWTAPTPCTRWNVRDLVEHVVLGNFLYAHILHDQPPAARDELLTPGRDLLDAYRDSATAVVGAFRQPGVLERLFTVPFGTVPGMVALHLRITELLVHGWDLARAIGYPPDFPEDIAEQELAFSRSKLAEVPADRSPFAPPQAAPEGASAIDRLAACLGRSVAADMPARGNPA